MNGVERLLGAEALARHGERVALICGLESVTYRELAARVRRASGALRQFGVRPGDRVAFIMRDTPEFAAAWLGAVRAGAVAIALNNRLSDTECRHVLADSGARLIVFDAALAGARATLSAELEREKRLARSDALTATSADEAPACTVDADSPAFVLYTSGTTARPKGIVHLHRSLGLVGAAPRRLGLSLLLR